MADSRTELDRALARTKPAGGEVSAVIDGAALPVGGDVEDSLRKRINDWLDSTSEVYASKDSRGVWVDGLVRYLMNGPGSLSEVLADEDAVAFLKRLVGAWGCCGTCAGGLLAAHDARVAAAAEKAAGERIAKAIEAEAAKYPRIGGMGLPTAARIARADRGGDRG